MNEKDIHDMCNHLTVLVSGLMELRSRNAFDAASKEIADDMEFALCQLTCLCDRASRQRPVNP